MKVYAIDVVEKELIENQQSLELQQQRIALLTRLRDELLKSNLNSKSSSKSNSQSVESLLHKLESSGGFGQCNGAGRGDYSNPGNAGMGIGNYLTGLVGLNEADDGAFAAGQAHAHRGQSTFDDYFALRGFFSSPSLEGKEVSQTASLSYCVRPTLSPSRFGHPFLVRGDGSDDTAYAKKTRRKVRKHCATRLLPRSFAVCSVPNFSAGFSPFRVLLSCLRCLILTDTFVLSMPCPRDCRKKNAAGALTLICLADRSGNLSFVDVDGQVVHSYFAGHGEKKYCLNSFHVRTHVCFCFIYH